jgi:hypothetical protein
MSPDRTVQVEGGYKYTATIKSYGGNMINVVFFLKGVSRRDLKRVRKWRIASFEVRDKILHIMVAPAEKGEKVDILQMIGRPGKDTNETIVSFMSVSEVHAGNNRGRPHRLPPQILQEAALG